MSERLFILIAVLPLITIMFILGLIYPKISRKEIIFGVKIPLEQLGEVEVKKILKNYYKKYLEICGSYYLIFIITLIIKTNNLVINLGFIIQFCIMIVLYIVSHNEIKKLKNKNRWNKRKREVVIVDTDFRKCKTRILPSIAWFLIPIIIIIINIIVGFSVFESLPLFIPSFWNVQGEIQGALLKTYKVIFIIPIIQLFITIFMIITFKIIGWSKQQLSIENPEISREKNRLFRYRWGVFIIVNNIIFVILNTIINFQLLQIVNVNYRILILLNPVITVIFLLEILFMFFWTGQGGSRINLKASNERKDKFVDRDEDRYWKLGLIYFNPDDAALFVEKRFGFGWGLNFGKISSYIFIIVIIVLVFLMNCIIKILSMP